MSLSARESGRVTALGNSQRGQDACSGGRRCPPAPPRTIPTLCRGRGGPAWSWVRSHHLSPALSPRHPFLWAFFSLAGAPKSWPAARDTADPLPGLPGKHRNQSPSCRTASNRAAFTSRLQQLPAALDLGQDADLRELPSPLLLAGGMMASASRGRCEGMRWRV